MFDLFSWSHILILLGVALVVVGPQELPRLMHMVGRWAGKAHGMANEFKRSFDEMARQTELDELRKEVEALRTNNPLTDIQNSLNEKVDVSPASEKPAALAKTWDGMQQP
jgi:sec-independent protein translocase protein TatB